MAMFGWPTLKEAVHEGGGGQAAVRARGFVAEALVGRKTNE
jgi:hypothetical protein